MYAVGCWLLCGLVKEGWWIQFGCFILSTYMMVELNNSNALIRIYSRMVSSAFIMLICAACFLFGSIHGAISQVCVIVTYLILFHTYQDKQSTGLTYYAFLFTGLASLAFVHILFFVPFLWLLMSTHLQSFSWRTFFASVMGVITPYWFGGCWLIYQEDFEPVTDHFRQLAEFQFPFDYSLLSASQIITFFFIVIIATIGTIHYWRTSYNDKIRIRQLYGIFIWMDALSILFVCLQPQHYDSLIRLMIINTAPLIAHFIALTQTRVTNITFHILYLTAIVLTAYNLWMSSFLF